MTKALERIERVEFLSGEKTIEVFVADEISTSFISREFYEAIEEFIVKAHEKNAELLDLKKANG